MIEQEKSFTGKEGILGKEIEEELKHMPLLVKEVIAKGIERLRGYGKLSEEELQKECRERAEEIIEIVKKEQKYHQELLGAD